MLSQSPGISIVIPNFNGEKIIIDTISKAIYALKTSDIKDYEIIVSDDASNDNSVSIIKKHFEDIYVLDSKINTGFSGNVNRGVRVATKELVLILNSDLHLGEGYFKSLIPLFKNSNVFGVMGAIKDPMTFKNQDGAKVPGLKYKMHIDSNTNFFSDTEVLPTFFLSGANALIRRDYFLQLDGFCELFNPYYSEDVELGIRSWKMGLEMYFDPSAVCYHEISSTINKIPQQRVRIIAKRNKYILHALHLPKNVLTLYVVNILMVAIARAIIGKTLHLKAFMQFFRLRNSIREERLKFNQLNGQKKQSLNEVVTKIKSLVVK